MKKFSSLLFCVTIAVSSLLTSCFSSSGELSQPNLPTKDGYHGQMVNTSGTTYVTAVSKVVGLNGYAVVPKEAATVLVNQGWGGILVILDEIRDKNVKTLANPLDVKSHNINAMTVKASCYPDGVKFGTNNYVRLAVTTDRAEGMIAHCYLETDPSDSLSVSSDKKGVYVDLPHFCNWIFTLNGKLNVSDEVEWVETEVMEHEVHDGENEWTDVVKYGFESDCTNPFVNSYIKALIGTAQTTTYTHFHTYVNGGYQKYKLKQEVKKFDVVTGSQTFTFRVLGKPVYVDCGYTSWNHSGGNGKN